MADEFHLTDDEKLQRLPSGQSTIHHNRVGWAKTFLKAAGLVEQPARGKVRISVQGRNLLSKNPTNLTAKMLKEFPAFNAFWKKTSDADDDDSTDKAASMANIRTPLELLTSSFTTLQEATKADLLARLKASDPAFFERAVLKLLGAMGYGGGVGEIKVTGRPGDGGIDGTISEDKLGLDVICVQAKRYDSGTVGRQMVQAFVGSMDLERSKKGVILTTSDFTKDAREFVHKIEGKRVVLIDGKMLADLMLRHNVGVSTAQTFELKEVSNDFFDEDLD